MAVNDITDAVRALIGLRSDWIEACHPVEASERRPRCTVHLLASSAKRSWKRKLPR